VLNSANGTAAGGTSEAATGYLVEADGKIKIPYIGKVQAEGISRLQLETSLTELFKDYTKNPVVNVRFLNYKFSVMGEVKSRVGLPWQTSVRPFWKRSAWGGILRNWANVKMYW
jgi:protein involved in polysaccharide export with SLBB domain